MKTFGIRYPLFVFLTLGLWLLSCNIGPEQTKQAFSMQHPEDLVGFDSLAIFLENPEGMPLDTLYTKKPVSADEFKNMIAPNFEGGEVVIHIKGFKAGNLALDNQIVYNTETNTVKSSVLTRSPNTKVVLAESVMAVTVGDTFSLPTAQVLPAGLSQTGVNWVSNSPNLLAATDGPRWVALAPGQASMKATWQGDASIYASLLVQIFDANPEETGSVGTSLNILPDSLILNAGAAPVNVPRIIGPTGSNSAISWTFVDPSIASAEGSQVFGKIAGRTKAFAALVGNASVVDSLWIIVRSTTPEWQMPGDTTVGVNLPVWIRPKLKQDFGTTVHFAWDAMGDGVWDDSASALKDLNLTWPQAGTYPMKLRIRDVEDHVVETVIRVKVVQGPDIRIVSPLDSSWVNTPSLAVTWTVNGAIQTDKATETLRQEGLNLITRSATDSAGNRFEVSVRVYLDTTGPAKPVFHGGMVGTTLTPTWIWRSGGGGNGQFRVSLDAPISATSPSQPETTYTAAAPLTEGLHTLYVQERDAAGNWSASASLGLKLDVTPPVKPEVVSKEGANTRNVRPGFVLRGKGGGMGIFRAKVDDSLFTADDSGKADTNYSPKADLNEGLHTIYAQERDSAGNWSATAQIQISVDLSAPGAPKISGKTPTNNPRPTWTWVGTSANGARIYRFGLNDSILTAKTPLPDTSYTPASPLTEGLHTLYVQERDSAGNWSETSQYPIRVDLTGPAKPVVTSPSAATNDLTPTWNWTGDDSDGIGSFRFKLDDSVLAAVTPSAVKTFTPTMSLTAGAHTLYVQEIDAAGNWSLLGSYTVTIDTAGPARPTVTGTASPTNDATPTWNWTGDATNGSGTFRFKLDTATFAANDPTTAAKTFTPAANLSAGAHTLYVQERDALGNWSANGQLTITVDLTGPAQPVVTGTATPTNDATPTWNWTGDATNGSGTFRFKLDTATFAANDPTTTVKTFTPSANLSAGNHTLYVQERDAAGNWSTSGTYLIAIDVTAPNRPTFTTVFKSPFNDLTPTWTWTSGGGGGNATYRVKVDDANLSTGYTTVSLASYTPGASLSEGMHTLYIQEMDAAGNGSPVANQAVLVAQRGYVGNAGFGNSYGFRFDMAMHPTGVPYVVYVDSVTQLTTVRRLNSSGTWEVVGNSGFSLDKCYSASIKMSPTGIPYVALTIQTGPYMSGAMVMRLNAASNKWEQVGTTIVANSYDCEVGFGPTGEVLFGYSVGFASEIHIGKLNVSGGWDDLAGGPVSTESSAYFSMTVSPLGVPHIAVLSQDGLNTVSVYKPNATNNAWMLIGFSSPIADVVNADYVSLAVDSSSTTWLAYSDPGASGRVSVYSCLLGSASWNRIGTAGFTSQAGIYVSIAIAPNGVPHVIGSEGAATLYRRNAAVASGWEIVGPTKLVANDIGNARLAITPAGVPYIAVNELANTSRLSVIRASFD